MKIRMLIASVTGPMGDDRPATVTLYDPSTRQSLVFTLPGPMQARYYARRLCEYVEIALPPCPPTKGDVLAGDIATEDAIR